MVTSMTILNGRIWGKSKTLDRRRIIKGRDGANPVSKNNYIKKLIRIPAATALPITPATFGAIACISK